MTDIFRSYVEERNKIIKGNILQTDKQRLEYLDMRENLRKQVALILCQLSTLLFNMEINEDDKQHEIIWNKIHRQICSLKLPKSRCYCVYRSPSRGSLDTELVQASKFPTCNHILIKDGNLVFTVNGKTIYGVLNGGFIRLVIDVQTQINIPKDLVQFEGDSISVEYVDVFFSRNMKGSFTGNKYMGFDMGRFELMKEKTRSFLKISTVREVIKLGTQILYFDKD